MISGLCPRRNSSRCSAVGAISSAALSEVQIITTRYTCLSKLEIDSNVWENGTASRKPNRIWTPAVATRTSCSSSMSRRELRSDSLSASEGSWSTTTPTLPGAQAACTPTGASRLRSDSIDLRMRRETCICETPTRSAISRCVRPS